MSKPAPVIIVDDDADEQLLIKEVWKELNLDFPVLYFSTGRQLLDYLKSKKEIPFLIICDINLPGMDGFEMRKKIIQNDFERYRSIPFVFWSGTATEEQILKAYDLSSHGFFIKPSTYTQLKEIIKDIVAYWQKSEIPFLHDK